jgi:hypothetical protein
MGLIVEQDKRYYSEVLKEVRSRALDFWKAQIGIGLLAGLVTVIYNVSTGVTTRDVLSRSVKGLLWGYAAAFGFGLIGAVLVAPLAVNRRRDDELSQAQKSIEALRQELREKEEALGRQHPHDKQLERKIQENLATLSPEEIRMIEYLLEVGQADNSELHQRGLRMAGPSLLERTGRLFVTYTSICPGNGLIEMDRIYSINPQNAQAIKNVLYPPN